MISEESCLNLQHSSGIIQAREKEGSKPHRKVDICWSTKSTRFHVVEEWPLWQRCKNIKYHILLDKFTSLIKQDISSYTKKFRFQRFSQCLVTDSFFWTKSIQSKFHNAIFIVYGLPHALGSPESTSVHGFQLYFSCKVLIACWIFRPSHTFWFITLIIFAKYKLWISWL
jgi:hypothetical protein